MTENNTFYCSFVSIHYIICECGETFPSEEALKEHLEKDKPHTKAEKKEEPFVDSEYKCGECEQLFGTEDECLEHLESVHTTVVQEEEVADTEIHHEPSPSPPPPSPSPPPTSLPFKVTSKPITVKPLSVKPIILARPVARPIVLANRPLKMLQPNQHVTDQSGAGKSLIINNQPIPVLNKPIIVKKQPLDFLNKSVMVGNQPVTVTVRNKPVKVAKERVKKEKKEKEPREPKEKKPKKPREQLKNVVCEVCGKKYTSAAALRYHQRVHTGVRPYLCAYCPKTFTMPLFQQIHQRIHTGERPYACPLCPKAFTNKAALLRHDRVHTGIKPYQCPRCGKSFSQSNSMKLHVHTVHLKLPTPYKSKKRRAEKLARECKVKGTLEVDDMNLVKTEIDFPEINDEGDVYYCDVDPKNEVTYEVIYEESQ